MESRDAVVLVLVGNNLSNRLILWMVKVTRSVFRREWGKLAHVERECVFKSF